MEETRKEIKKHYVPPVNREFMNLIHYLKQHNRYTDRIIQEKATDIIYNMVVANKTMRKNGERYNYNVGMSINHPAFQKVIAISEKFKKLNNVRFPTMNDFIRT